MVRIITTVSFAIETDAHKNASPQCPPGQSIKVKEERTSWPSSLAKVLSFRRGRLMGRLCARRGRPIGALAKGRARTIAGHSPPDAHCATWWTSRPGFEPGCVIRPSSLHSSYITAVGFRRQGCGYEQEAGSRRLEARRLEGARLLRRGAKLPEVARRLKVSRKRQIGDPGSSIRPDVL